MTHCADGFGSSLDPKSKQGDRRAMLDDIGEMYMQGMVTFDKAVRLRDSVQRHDFAQAADSVVVAKLVYMAGFVQ